MVNIWCWLICFPLLTSSALFPGPPTFDKTPQNKTSVAGEDVFLECEVSGDPAPKTRWTRMEADGSEMVLDLPRFKVIPGKGLRLRHVHPSQGGVYKCTATSAIGSVSAEAVVDVHEGPLITVRPPLQVVVPVGDSATVDCVVSGAPVPVILWMQERDRTVLLPGDRTESGLGVTPRGSLRISNAQISSSYVCLASNVVGSAMARTNVIVVASKADADQMRLMQTQRKNQIFLQDLNETPARVSSLTVFGLSSSSIKVSWKLALDSSHRVDGFYILYRPKIGQPPGFTSITVLHAAATSYVVNRLEPHTPYEFLVVPFRRGLSGQPSPLYEAWTMEARPSHFPTNLRWYQVNSSSVDIVWKPLKREQFRGEPLGYQVRSQSVDFLPIWEWQPLCYLIPSLFWKQGVMYTVCWQA